MTLHDDKLFTPPDSLPKTPDSLPILRVQRAEELLDGTYDYESSFAERVQRAQKRFHMQECEPQRKGDRTILRDGSRVLEVFLASDAEWWTDQELAYPETLGESSELPSPEDARDRADEYLTKLDLGRCEIELAGVSRNRVSTLQSECSEEYTTSLDVNYTFRSPVREAPILGPGAKIKVTLGAGSALAQVMYFFREWADPNPEERFKVIDPESALSEFQCLDEFGQLHGTGARIAVQDVQLGLYALAPGKLQRFYLPVYQISATAHTRRLPNYRFQRYLPAWQLSAAEAKRLRVAENPNIAQLL